MEGFLSDREEACLSNEREKCLVAGLLQSQQMQVQVCFFLWSPEPEVVHFVCTHAHAVCLPFESSL